MRKKIFGFVAFVGAAATWLACGSDSASIDAPADAGPEGGEDVLAAPDTSVPDAAPDAGGDAGADADAASDGGPTNLDGGACDGGNITVAKATPQFGWSGGETAITITGAGFQATPRVFLRNGAGALTPLDNPAFVSDTSLTGVVPSGLAAGAYDVVVIDPSDCAGVLAGAFTVVANAPPTVLDVTPSSGTTKDDVQVVVTGCHFPANATLSTISSTGTEVVHANSAPVAGGNDARCGGDALYTMNGTIETHTKALAVGAYLVRVNNPTDKTFGEYASFVVSNPNGNLSGGWKASPSLNVGRRSLGLVSGRVNNESRFLYAIGGEDAAGNALATVEIAPVDRFGQLGAWTIAKATLGTARSGLAVVRQGKYLYAIGGTASKDGTGGAAPSGSPLSSVERAAILDPSGAPTLANATVAAGGGTLAKGTYYYRVSAVLDATDPATEGETLASREVTASLDAAGHVALAWTAPATGAVAHYRVYRTKSADDPAQTEVLLADNVATTTYSDTGADTPGTDKPLAVGSTGPWVTVGTSLLHARLDTAAAIAPDTSGNLHVYVAGGYGQCLATTGIMDCTEHTTISADGATLGGVFLAGTTMAHARMRHGLTAMTTDNGPADFATNAGSTRAFLVVAGGKGISNSGNTVEAAAVGAAGVTGAWAVPTSGFANERDGTQLLVANGYAYAFLGGGAPAYSLTSDQSALATVTPTALTFANWANAGANMTQKRGRHATAAESAFFYTAGGTSNDNDALTTVYQILH